MSIRIERVPPSPGQESVWDYPRPPRVERTPRHIQVIFNGLTLADTRRAVRVLETSQAPVYYLPPEDVLLSRLDPAEEVTLCEWKGLAHYYDLVVGDRTAKHAAWTYPEPAAGYELIRGYLAFYPQRMDRCLVDGEAAQPMPGGFYGGWITRDVVGPFKGGPGTQGW
jgi:uncharacterized protein (DUF427 family)